MWNASLKEGHSFSPLRRSAVAKLLFLALVLFTLSFFVNHESFDGGKEGLRKLDSSLTGTRLLAESHEHIHGDKAGNTGNDRGVRTTVSEKAKPIMYTFFEPVGEGACCGMTNQEHQDLLAVWKKSWEEKGWVTRILTKEDAQKHPKFDEYDKALVKFIGGSFNDDNNRRCFWRWLAMVQVGGGWMSDYDTFPLELDAKLGKQLAEQELSFKSYCYTAPCLIYASASEWDRVYRSMMDILPSLQEQNEFISDMTAFSQLGRSVNDKKLWAFKTTPRFEYTVDDSGSFLVDCTEYDNKLAVHLCHHSVHVAVSENKYPLSLVQKKDTDEAVERRAEAAAILMADYDKQCTAYTD